MIYCLYEKIQQGHIHFKGSKKGQNELRDVVRIIDLESPADKLPGALLVYEVDFYDGSMSSSRSKRPLAKKFLSSSQKF